MGTHCQSLHLICGLAAVVLLVNAAAARSDAADSISDFVLGVPKDGQAYFVAFCSEPGLVGHVFVAIGSYDRERELCRHELAVGFWPSGDKEKHRLKAAFSAKPGILRDEGKRPGGLQGASSRLTKWLTPEEYTILQIKMAAQAPKQYHLTGENCVSFVAEVARAVSLRVPDQQKLLKEWDVPERIKALLEKKVIPEEAFPEFYLRRLVEMNQPK